MNSIKFKERLESDRLILFIPEATFENAKLLFSYVDKNREELWKWLPWLPTNTKPEHSFEFLQSCTKQFESGKRAEYFIIEKATGDFCGLCHTGRYDSLTTAHFEFGYWLDKDKYGKGYITEAVKVLEDDLFAQKAPRLVIKNDTENLGSINVAKRLGYHLDGVLRADFYSERLQSYRDVNIWSKLHPDIEKQRG